MPAFPTPSTPLGGMYQKFAANYHKRYIRTGSAAPIFHLIGGVVVAGILLESKVHKARVADGAHAH